MLNNTHLLNKKNQIWNYDIQLITVTVSLCIFGLVFLASSLSGNPQINENRYWPELAKQLVAGIGIGFVALIWIARTDYHKFIKWSPRLVLVTTIMLVFVGFMSIIAFVTRQDPQTLFELLKPFPIRPNFYNGAARWINMPLNLPDVQPSEIAKITILLFFSGVLAKFNNGFTLRDIKQPLWILGGMIALILAQPDLGTSFLISCIVLSAFWTSGMNIKTLFKIVVGVAIVGLIFVYAFSWRRDRVSGESAQVGFIKSALKNGGIVGKGYGNSEVKQEGKIYEANTDAIIGVVGEEVGFVGTTVLMCLYFFMFYRGMKIAEESVDMEGKILAVGVTVWVGLQVLMNVNGMTGLIPMKGLPLPFISQGGTAIIMNLVAVGFLLNISSQKKSGPKLKKIVSI